MEFAFAGIPILFVILGVMEMARCMWTFETLSYAVTEGTRMAVVHGENCANKCSITVGAVAQRIADSSGGLLTNQMSVTLISGDGTTTACNPLSSCLNNPGVWPVPSGNTRGTAVTITAVYPFDSPMGLLLPGAGGSTSFVANLPASSQEQIQF